MKDPYETLGLKKGASGADIKRAYRRKAAKLHPDRNPNSHEAMAQVNTAYALLSDEGRRQHFDQTGEDIPSPNSDENLARRLWVGMLAKQLERAVAVMEAAPPGMVREHDIAAAAQAEIAGMLAECEREIAKAKRYVAHLAKLKKRVSTTDTVDHWADLLASNSQGAQNRVAALETDLKRLKLAHEIAQLYRSPARSPQPAPGGYLVINTSSA